MFKKKKRKKKLYSLYFYKGKNAREIQLHLRKYCSLKKKEKKRKS